MAFAVSAEIPQDEVEEVRSCMQELSGGELLISEKIRVNIIKGDIKERKGRAMLIFRYQHMGGF